MRRLGLLGVAIGIVLCAIALWASTRQPANEYSTPAATTYSSGPEGAMGLYQLLDELGLHVARERRALHGQLATTTVLWSLAETPLTVVQQHDLCDFVRRGGTVVMPALPVAPIYEALGIEPKRKPEDPATHFAHKLHEDSKHAAPLVDRYEVGPGHLVVIDSLDDLRDRALKDHERGLAFAKLAQSLGQDHLFDENVTGFGETSLWSLARRAPYRFGLLQLGLALLVTIAVSLVRIGPPLPVAPPMRRDARAHVEAVAELWQRAGDAGLPLDALLRGLDQRAISVGVQAGTEPAFVRWTKWRRPALASSAAQLWLQAEQLRALPRPDTARVLKIAMALRALEKEVFRAG